MNKSEKNLAFHYGDERIDKNLHNFQFKVRGIEK